MGNLFAFVLLYVVCTMGSRQDGGLSQSLTVAIKGVAAILIVLTHCITLSGVENPFVNSLKTGWLSVTVFFFLSGFGSAYGLSKKEGYAKHFLRNRFVRVGIPYLLAHIVYGAYRVCAGRTLSVEDLLHGFFQDKTIVPLSWYPVVALCFYVFIRAAFRLAARSLPRIALLGGFVAAFTFALWFWIGKEYDHWFISNFSFVFGVALQMFDPKLRYRKIMLSAAAVCAAGGFLILPVCSRLFGTYIYPAYILSCNLGSGFLVTALMLLLTITGGYNKITTFLGKISYEIYLYHVLFIWVCKDFLHVSSWYVLFLITVSAVVPFAALMHMPDSFLCGKLCKRTEAKQDSDPENSETKSV